MEDKTNIEPNEISKSACADRRYVRSRRMIYEAFVSLVEENGLDDFTIGDLVERADLNRSTFYSHFNSKEDLIKSFEDDFLAGLSDVESHIASVSPRELGMAFVGNQPLRALVEMFDYLRESGSMLAALIGENGDISFEHRLIDTTCTTLVNKILDPKYQNDPSRMVAYYVSYFTSAVIGVVRTWLDNGMEESSEDMAAILIHLSFLQPGDPIGMEGEFGE